MKPSRVRDPRLHRRPAVIRTGSGFKITDKILTPARLTAALYLFWMPVRSVARLLLVVLGIWWGGAYAGIWAFPDGLPFNWRMVFAASGGAIACWLGERALGFPFTRCAVGKRLIFSIDAESLYIGQWPFQKRYSLDQRLVFVHVPFSSALSPVYQNAQLIALIVGDVRRVPIAECFGVLHASRLVSNLNVALSLGVRSESVEVDFDAQSQALARTKN